MSVLCCTKKLRKEMGVKDNELVLEPESCTGVGTWYANLLRFGPKKCVLFINSRTCYGVVALDVRRPEICKLGELLLNRLPSVMRSDRFSEEIIERVVSEYREFYIGKGANKSILGYLTDMGRHVGYAIESAGSVEQANEIVAARRVNHMPLMSFDGLDGFELFSILLTGGVRDMNNEYKRKRVEKYRNEFGIVESAERKTLHLSLVPRMRD